MTERKLGKLTLCVQKDADYFNIIALDQLGNKVDSKVAARSDVEKTLNDMKKHWEAHNFIVKIDKSEDAPLGTTPHGKFELYKDAAGKFRFRLKAANNKIIAASEAYESKRACQNGIQSIMQNAAKARVLDLTA